MIPKLICNKKFKMEDGSKPAITVDKEYEITCAFEVDGVEAIQVINDDEMVHLFYTDEEWFSEHFTIVGDVQTVWEEV